MAGSWAVTRFEWDAAGRLIGVERPDGAREERVVETFTFPKRLAATPDGWLTVGIVALRANEELRAANRELRAKGHVSQTVRVSSLTQENLTVTLDKEQRSRRRRRTEPAAAPTPAPAAPVERPRRRQNGPSEVLDPWS